jgi:hypothetical protein
MGWFRQRIACLTRLRTLSSVDDAIVATPPGSSPSRRTRALTRTSGRALPVRNVSYALAALWEDERRPLQRSSNSSIMSESSSLISRTHWRTNADPWSTEKEMILQKQGERVVVGVPARLTTLSRHSGHGRVWTEVLDRLSRMTQLVVGTDKAADVWLDNGHEPDPEITGPVVACAYEVSWGTPELDVEFPPDTLRKLSDATAQAMARATHVVTGAHTSKKQIVDYYGLAPRRVHVYPFGVDQELFHPRRAPEGRALVRERTGDDRPYLIFTSAISPRKNLQAVREALLRLADRGFPHVLVIVASDPPGDFDRKELRRQAFAELPGHPGRILQFVDPSDEELASLIAGATAACQPSRFEGFGLPALEAMASGVPVVVGDRTAPPEVVGRAGWVVEPTAEGVEQALLEIMEYPVRAQRVGARARRRAESFTWDRTANGWLHILRRAARQSR